jgi:tetratricopeptide (TPR) repeat protein
LRRRYRGNMALRKSFVTLSSIVSVTLIMACGGAEEKKRNFFNRGQQLYQKGEFVKARLEFKNALQIDPKFANAYHMLGRVELQEKNLKLAFAALSRAVELNPGLLDAQVDIGKIFLLTKQKDKASRKADLVLTNSPYHEEGLLLKAGCLILDQKENEVEPILISLIERNTEKPDAYLMLARLKLRNKDMDSATGVLEDLLSRDKNNKAAHLLLAEVLEKRKELSAAESEYKTLIKQDPNDDSLKLMLASFYDRTNRNDKAEKTLERAISTYPEKENFRIALARFYHRKKRNDAMGEVLRQTIRDLPEKYGAYEILAMYHLKEEANDRAIKILDQFMVMAPTGPSNLKAKLLKATIRFQEKNSADALKLVEEVLKENPHDVRAHFLKGDILANQGDFAGAISEYRTILHGEPLNVRILLKIAKAHLLNNEPRLSEVTYRNILEIEPKAREARIGLANLYRQERKLELEKEQLEKVLELAPSDREALFRIARIEESLGSVDKSLSKYEKLRQKNPKNVGIAMLMAILLERKGEPAKAKSVYEDVLAENPGLLTAANNLAFYYAEYEPTDQNLAKAENLVKPLLPKYKNVLHLVDTMAWIYYRQGYYDKAWRLLLAVEEKIPDIPVINYHMGMIYLSLGEKAKAKKHLQLAVNTQEPFPGREEAMKALARRRE